MKSLFLILAAALCLSQAALANCPDRAFILNTGSVTFDGPGDGRVHTSMNTNPGVFFTVTNFKYITDIKAAIQLYEGNGYCMDIASCDAGNGNAENIQSISVYSSVTPLGGGQITCNGDLLYERMYNY